MNRALALCLLLMLLLLPPLTAEAQVRDDEREGLAEQLQVPVSDLMNVVFYYDVDLGQGPADENLVSLTVMPQLPVQVLKNWKVVVWPIFLWQSVPPAQPGGERLNGMGDTVLRLLVATAGPKQGLFFGLGPAFLAPTATRTELGSGAFSVGAAGTFGWQGRPWTAGIVAHHLRSVSEAVGKPEDHRSAIRPYISWTSPSGVTLGLNSQTRASWEGSKSERWLVPIEATAGQLGTIGNQAVNFTLGARYFVESPRNGPDWGVRMEVTLLFPTYPGPPQPQPPEQRETH